MSQLAELPVFDLLASHVTKLTGRELMLSRVLRLVWLSILVDVVMWSTPIFADALAQDVWNPTGLSFDRCLQLGQKAMGDLGSKDVRPEIKFTGMGFVEGSYGDYTISIICMTAKDVVVFSVAAHTVLNYLPFLNRYPWKSAIVQTKSGSFPCSGRLLA
jgi:hypothetical protein